MKANTLIGIIVVILIAAGGYYSFSHMNRTAITGNAATSTVGMATSDGIMADPHMVGAWKSNTDPKFTREFKADGTVVDSYEGEPSATATGTYTVVDPMKETIGGVSGAALVGVTAIKVMWQDGTVTYFAVNNLTDTTLITTDLSGTGSVTMYTRM